MRRHFWRSHTFKFWFMGYLCILMLPLIASMFYFGGVQQSLTEKTAAMSQKAIEQAAGVIDEKLKMVGRVGDSIYVSSEIKRIKFLSLPYDAATYYELHSRASYLGNFSFQTDLFRYLYVYYSDMDCLMDSQRLFTQDNQIQTIIRNNMHMEPDEFMTLTAQHHYNRFHILPDGTILFLRTLSTRGPERCPIITLVAVINTASIQEMLTQTGLNAEGGAWLIAQDSTGIISGSGESCPMDNNALMSLKARGTQAVADAMTLCVSSEHPGLMYVLSIPKDVYLLEITKTQRWFWGISIIALSLGVLFSYYFTVRNYRPIHALKQRFSGEDTKNDFCLINAKLSELLDEESSMQSEIRRLDNIAGKRAFHLLLTGGVDTLDERQRDSIRFNGSVFVVAWLCRDDGLFSVKTKSGGDADPESVLELILGHLCEDGCEFAVQQECNDFVVVFCFVAGTEAMDAQQTVCDLCKRLTAQLVEHSPHPLDRAYVGDAQTGIENICISYRNALRAKEYAEFMPDTRHDVVPFDPLMYSAEISWQDYDIMDAERSFISQMLEGNYAGATQQLHEIMSYYSCTDGMNLYVMRCRMFGVMNMMLNVLHEIEPDMMISAYSDFSPLEALISARSPSELEKVVFNIIGQLVGAQESRTGDAHIRVKQIQRYIAANYFDVNLSVQMVADAYHISLPYLSRIFKKEYGTGLLDYINRYRVDKAKGLMEASAEESITSIASRVGFGSSQTLIRAFKRYGGITPGQYRQSLQKTEDELAGQKMPVSDI